MQRRHQQGRVFLMARVWTVYLGFITGMSLALVGAAFILGRIQGSQTNATLEAGQVKAQILASSPGIILSFLGTILMVTTIMVNHTIRIEDQNIYLRGGSEASSPPSVDPDVLRFPSFPGLPGESASSPRK